MRLLIQICLLLVACDPRGNFVGRYEGTIATTVTYFDGERFNAVGPTTVIITAPEGDNLLHFSGACTLTARPDGKSFTIDPKACPQTSFTFNDGTVCTETLSIEAGSGSVSDASLNAGYSGRGVINNCSDGYSDSYSFTAEVAAVRSQASGPPAPPAAPIAHRERRRAR